MVYSISNDEPGTHIDRSLAAVTAVAFNKKKAPPVAAKAMA